MRNFVLLLVLINLGALAWFRWVVPPPPAPAPWDGPGITLLRELEDDAAILLASRPPEFPPTVTDAALAPADESSPAPVESPSVPAGVGTLAAEAADAAAPAESSMLAQARCVAIGPFTEVDQADAARTTLIEAGFDPALSVSEDQVWDGYWVFIGRLESRDAANAALARLAESGLSDAYVIPNSDSGILISLGVYSDISRAGALVGRVGSLGFDATITERTRTAETRWLELELSGEESRALELLQAPGRIRRLEQRGCQNDDGV